jgi:hypothetical protein
VETIDEKALLPDGSEVLIRARVFDDPYIEDETETVGGELVVNGETAAALNTVLDPDEEVRGESSCRKSSSASSRAS